MLAQVQRGAFDANFISSLLHGVLLSLQKFGSRPGTGTWLNGVKLMCDSAGVDFERHKACVQSYAALTTIACRPKCGSNATEVSARANIRVHFHANAVGLVDSTNDSFVIV